MRSLRSTRWDGRTCVLVDRTTGKELTVGDPVSTRREPDAHTILAGGQAPHKPSSTGRVYVSIEGFVHTYYPSVIDAEWVEEES